MRNQKMISRKESVLYSNISSYIYIYISDPFKWDMVFDNF